MNEHPSEQPRGQDTTQPPANLWFRRIDIAARNWKIFYLALAINMMSAFTGIVTFFFIGLPTALTTGDFSGAGAGLVLAGAGGIGLWKDGTEGLERGLRDLSTAGRSAISHLTRTADDLNNKADQLKKALGR
jgi:hypothetical protein